MQDNNNCRRTFSRREKQAVELVEDREGEADHIYPYSKGGKTSVENCQIISSQANKKKGVFAFKPRNWQKRFFKRWDKRQSGEPFLLIAVPGSGKTMACLEVARRWMQAGPDRRIIVVVPTSNLREQWKGEANKFGIQLQTKEFGNNFKHGFQVAVATYPMVSKNQFVFRKLCSTAPTLVVFDEVHHCGQEASFGEGISEAFGLAKERLLMSGTPWKSDGEAIPFVKYDTNRCPVGDFIYGYGEALNDLVVRTLVFELSKGTVKNESTGEASTLVPDIADEQAAKTLFKLLDPDGDYVKEQIKLADEKLDEVRKTTTDAGGLVLCMDQYHASKVAKVIRQVTGTDPSVILSDSAETNDSVQGFKASKKKWLVAVRQVSEGTDIKRLQVLCYLTNTATELFFRQAVGRVSRLRGVDDCSAYVHLPADPRLERYMRDMENEQLKAMIEQADKVTRERAKSEQTSIDFSLYSTSHDGIEVAQIGREKVSTDVYFRVKKLAEEVGIPLIKAYACFQSLIEQEQPQLTSPEVIESEVSQPKEDRMIKLRKNINQQTNVLARRRKVKPKEIHLEFAKRFNKKQASMTEEELEFKYREICRENASYGRS